MAITRKMKKAFDLVTTDGESKSKALLQAGYAPSVARAPQMVTERVGWQELLNKHLSQQSLAQQHQGLLATGKEETKVKLLDMGYKLHGVYAPERSVNVDITLKPSEHKAIADEYEKRLLDSISAPVSVSDDDASAGEGRG